MSTAVKFLYILYSNVIKHNTQTNQDEHVPYPGGTNLTEAKDKGLYGVLLLRPEKTPDTVWAKAVASMKAQCELGEPRFRAKTRKGNVDAGLSDSDRALFGMNGVFNTLTIEA